MMALLLSKIPNPFEAASNSTNIWDDCLMFSAITPALPPVKLIFRIHFGLTIE